MQLLAFYCQFETESTEGFLSLASKTWKEGGGVHSKSFKFQIWFQLTWSEGSILRVIFKNNLDFWTYFCACSISHPNDWQTSDISNHFIITAIIPLNARKCIFTSHLKFKVHVYLRSWSKFYLKNHSIKNNLFTNHSL